MNNNIEKYGYNDFFKRQIDELNISSENLIPARVIEVQKEQYKLVTEYGENAGKLKGSLFYNDKIYNVYPTIGDFVLLRHNPLGEEIMKVNTIREADSKGRHTTTHRQLIKLENDAMIIDTPGMRELEMWNVSEALDIVFDEIEELSKKCKFRDCTHEREPGCAVKIALEIGELTKERWDNYIKLKKEARFAESKENAGPCLKEKAKWKSMSKFQKGLNQLICLKEYICEKDYKEINKLHKICNLQDKTNLKLELDYRLNVSKHSEIGLKKINEFFYYVEEVLVAYIGISSFGANIGEVNGMTHPEFRRKGIFKKLFELAIEECQKRNFDKILLLTDGKSDSGIEFIKAVRGNYDFSEYRMRLSKRIISEGLNSISLRKAVKLDSKEIGRQNSIFFNDSEEKESFPEEEEELNKITYMAELKKGIIGKVRVNYDSNSAFISGFGILPAFRGKGYGKEALKGTLCLINEKGINEIELDVECKNNTALNLYKSCGFEEKSVMNYYNYSF